MIDGKKERRKEIMIDGNKKKERKKIFFNVSIGDVADAIDIPTRLCMGDYVLNMVDKQERLKRESILNHLSAGK